MEDGPVPSCPNREADRSKKNGPPSYYAGRVGAAARGASVGGRAAGANVRRALWDIRRRSSQGMRLR